MGPARMRVSLFGSRGHTFFAPLLISLVACAAVGRESSAAPLSTSDRKALVEAICERLDRLYPFEDIAARTLDGIQKNHRSGQYDGIDSPEEFARRLTDDMERLSQDQHLELFYDPTLAAEIMARESAGDAQTGPGPTRVEQMRWENFGFKELRILDGHVGYLDLRVFFSTKYAGSIAVAALDFLSLSKAMIIDLRRNGGGSDDMVMLLASYFVDVESPEVLSIAQSTLDETYYASVISAYVPGKKLSEIPLYILISDSTASAAEGFASVMKHLNNNVVLVGETTAGAENPVERVAISQDFVLKIPCWKKIYFASRRGWEGTGIQPDVSVPSDLALETAHLHALQTLMERNTDVLAREKLQWGIDGRRAVLRPEKVQETLLESYVGRYGSATVLLEEGHLYVQYPEQPRKKLYAVSEDYFLVEDRDDVRLRFVREQGRVVGMEYVYSDGYRYLKPKD